MVFLVFGKILFLAIYFHKTSQLGFLTFLGVFGHGAALDFSTLGYLLLLPLLFITLTSFNNGRILYILFKSYTWILLIVFSILIMSDIEIYKYWGFRLDKSCLVYLSNPGDMFASVEWYTILLDILSAGIIAGFFIFIAERFVLRNLKFFSKAGWLSLTTILIVPLLIIPIRGGFDTSSINVSSAYFSKNMFANHAAINLFWNVGYSLTNKDDTENPFKYYSKDTADLYLSELYKTFNTHAHVLKNKRPDIFLIILESYTSKLIEPLDGEPGITPRFNKLTEKGIFFKQIYATGTRSERGIAALISGFPSVDNISIMAYPHKYKNLPSLIKILHDTGYSSEFYYGGDINFFNFKSYFMSIGYDKLVSKSDFHSKDILSKWGVPDHILFDRLTDDLDNNPDTPFIKTLFTLSNHEPFDIPVKGHFGGSGLDNRLFSAAYYTDSCIGHFIDNLKQSPWWNKSLVIFIADHGIMYPGNYPYNARQNYHIPMLWTGGAISKDTVINAFGSQNDIPLTILNQLGIKSDKFIFSRDILADPSNSFVIYNFKDGFGYLSDSVKFLFDRNWKNVEFLEDSKPDSQQIKYSKAFAQKVYDYFLNP